MFVYVPLFVCLRYDPVENTWLELPNMTCSRALAGSVVYQDKIYVIGTLCCSYLFMKFIIYPQKVSFLNNIFEICKSCNGLYFWVKYNGNLSLKTFQSGPYGQVVIICRS